MSMRAHGHGLLHGHIEDDDPLRSEDGGTEHTSDAGGLSQGQKVGRFRTEPPDATPWRNLQAKKRGR